MSGYYGEDLGPGEVEWMEPNEPPMDPDEEDAAPVDLDDNDSQPHYREERYTGTVRGIDYGNSKRPGADPYDQSHGRLSPRQIPCLDPPEGCGAKVGEKCHFETERVSGQMGQRKRETVKGTRRMPCVSRIRRADKTT